MNLRRINWPLLLFYLLMLAGPGRNYFPICDNYLKTNCPELHTKLMKQRTEFDKQYAREAKKEKKEDPEKTETGDGVPF